MGSPVSPLTANIFMEWLEQQAILTAPLECKPRVWKRYVDDVLEIVKRDTAETLTAHLNQVDTTSSIKFTYEVEQDQQIPFLDTLIVRKPDKSIKLMVYRKKTHTDQYLSFTSHHPLHQKMGVVRTLLDRKDRIVTEEEDKIKEEAHIRQALAKCGYPKWTIDRVKKQMEEKQQRKTKKNKSTTSDQKSKGLVVIPYVAGVSERISRTLKKHDIATAMRPHSTIRKMVVHPKDKQEPVKTPNCVYEIPCGSCDLTYVGETKRTFGTRMDEHRREAEKASQQKYTRSKRKESESHFKNSAISDHVARANHIINWGEAKNLRERK
ncbi:uncharacterized protein [Amphiura filiformis]|uniref:uncharacterized protein n=1 Tax=Amphiura filiformis TaxID=82378 RepID=UPI003B20C12D